MSQKLAYIVGGVVVLVLVALLVSSQCVGRHGVVSGPKGQYG